MAADKGDWSTAPGQPRRLHPTAGARRVGRVGPVMAAAVVEREGIAAVGVVPLVDGTIVVVLVVVAIALTWVVVVVFVVVAIAWHSL